VGGQPTVAFDIDIPAILTGSGFEHVELVTEGADIADAVARIAARPRSALVIETVQGSRPDLGRPTVSPSANKVDMIKEFEGTRR
jgi:phosphonopyruvate decarboxylase